MQLTFRRISIYVCVYVYVYVKYADIQALDLYFKKEYLKLTVLCYFWAKFVYF